MIVCLFLLIAAYQDLKLRLVDGNIWFILLILIIPVNLIRLILYWNEPSLLLFIILSMALGIILAFLMLILGLWGGADILALICLSLISPISIKVINGLPSIYNTNFLTLILPLSLALVMNAAIIQIPLPFIILAKNYRQYMQYPERYSEPKTSKIKKLFACCLGEPLPVSSILTKPIFHYQVLEKNHEFSNQENLNEKYPVPFVRLASEPLLRWQQYRRTSYSLLQPNIFLQQKRELTKLQNPSIKREWSFDFSIGLKSEEEDLYRQRMLIGHAVTEQNLRKNYLWVQYSIPFLIPMFVGYILAFNGINILFLVLQLLHLM